jgi:hypothetical protein
MRHGPRWATEFQVRIETFVVLGRYGRSPCGASSGIQRVCCIRLPPERVASSEKRQSALWCWYASGRQRLSPPADV